jgi:hypothetical protein
MLLGGFAKQFEILDEGVHNAVLAAVQNLGLVTSSYDGTEKLKVRFVWISDELDKEGDPIVTLQSMTNSMHEKSTLRKTVKGILGRDPGDEPLDDSLVLGAQCQIVITHNESNGRTFANVVTATRQKSDVRVDIPEGWQPPKVKKYKAADDECPI